METSTINLIRSVINMILSNQDENQVKIKKLEKDFIPLKMIKLNYITGLVR